MDIFYSVRLCFLLHNHHLLCMSVGGRHLRVADVNHSGKVNSHMYCFSFRLSLPFLFLHTLLSSNIYMSVRGRHLHVADVDHYGKVIPHIIVVPLLFFRYFSVSLSHLDSRCPIGSNQCLP